MFNKVMKVIHMSPIKVIGEFDLNQGRKYDKSGLFKSGEKIIISK